MAILHEHIEGKYEILGKIREGGMGAVYKVRHRLLDEIRVVKVLHPRLSVTPELNDRFLREARLAIRLRHPNIAQLHDFSVAEDGSAFIVMEFIDGITLEGMLAKTGPPPLGLGLEIGRQSLKALGFLHRRGLVHRDISPDNLMLTHEPEGDPLVKLIDLGIAKVLAGEGGGLTSTGMFLGKPRYASPEQFNPTGPEGVDARSDLYSFGVVLYELLTGVCPIQGNDVASLMAGHLFRPPIDFQESDPRWRLPPDLREILLCALAKDREERFASAEAFSSRLAEVQAHHPLVPGDLDNVLLAAAEPAGEPTKPGSTQDKIDRQFVQGGLTPTPTVRGEPLPEATLVLPRATTPVPAETFTAPALADSVQPPGTVAVPPPLPPLPRALEAPKLPPRQREERGRTARRNLVLVAAALLLSLGLSGGLWWLLHGGSQPEAAKPPSPTVVVSTSPEPGPTMEAGDRGAVPVPPSVAPRDETPADSLTPAPATSPALPPAAPEPSPRPPAREVQKPQALQSQSPKPVKSPEPAPPERSSPRPAPPERTPAAPTPAPALTPSSKELATDEVDLVPARFLSAPTPTFPEAARGTGTYARILVAVLVDESGSVVEAKVKNAYLEEGAGLGQRPGSSSLISAFREAALEAASKARFEPGSRNGVPVKTREELRFEFGKKPRN